MRIFLIRHARHDHYGRILSGRSGDISLTVEGRREAQRLSSLLGGTKIASIHSSPQRRCVETAMAIARVAQQEVRIMGALDEIDFGAWSGMAFSDLEADPRWTAWNRARGRSRAPGGETMGEATTRAVRHLETLVGTDAPVLCVTHCDVIRGVVGHYLGLDPDNILRFDIDPASVSIVDVGDWGGKVSALNRVAA